MERRNLRAARMKLESFPIEIKTQILSMVPVRYVLRCRAVCKSWRNLIDDHGFASLHLDREIESSGSDKSVFLFIPTDILNAVYIVEKVKEDSPYLKATKISLSIPEITDPSPYVYLCGSVNGLFSFGYYDGNHERAIVQCFICNPFRKQFIKLPELIYSRNMGIEPILCCNPTNKQQFKVLVLFRSCDPENKAYIFTLGSNYWKELKKVPNVGNCCGPVALDGFVYWLTDDSYLWSFNLASEVVGPVLVPELQSTSYRDFRILDGCLCICDLHGDDCDVWVMRGESWTKYNIVIGRYDVYKIEPISFWKRGDILLLCDSWRLVSYDFESGVFTPVGIHGFAGVDSYKVYPYCGNLVSLESADHCLI